MEVLVAFLVIVGLVWFTLVGVFSAGFTIAAFKAKGPLLKIAFFLLAASPFLYQHVQQSLNQRNIENRAEFVKSLDRTPLERKVPRSMVSLGRLDEADKLRLFERFGIEEFYVHVKKNPFTVESDFEFVSIFRANDCADRRSATTELWQLEPGLEVCVRSTSMRINRDDLPRDALYFLQGEETSFSSGLVGRTKFGPLGGSRQFELRNGKDGPLIEYFETGIEAKAEIFLKTHYSNASGTPRTWRFLQQAIDPEGSYGGHTKGRHVLRPVELRR